MVDKRKINSYLQEINIVLHREFCKDNSDDVYTPAMVDFLNSIEGLEVKFFSDVSEINTYLKTIEDVKSFQEFYDEHNGVINDTLLVSENEGIHFIENGGFQEYLESILNHLEIEESVRFNSYIMNLLFYKYLNKGD